MLPWLALALLVAGLLLLVLFRRRPQGSPRPLRDRRARQAGWAALGLGLAALAAAWFRHSRGRAGRDRHQPPDTKDLFR